MSIRNFTYSNFFNLDPFGLLNLFFGNFPRPTTTSVHLTADQIYSAKSSDAVFGSTGNETVAIAKTVNAVAVDNKVENISFAGGIFDYTFRNLGQKIVVSNRSVNVVVTDSPAQNGTKFTFSDGSAATASSNNYGFAQLHYDQVQSLPNYTITLSNGDVSVKGAAGNETVRLSAGLHNVTVDANVEKVVLPAALQASNITYGPGLVSVSDGSGAKLVDLAVAPNHAENLAFLNASGTLTVDNAGNGAFVLTDVYLDTNETYTPDSNGIAIHGNFTWWFNNNYNIVNLTADVANETIDANVSEVDFAAGLAGYTFQNSNDQLLIFNTAGQEVAAIQVPYGNSGTTLKFANETYNATMASDGIYINGMAVPTSVAGVLTPSPVPGNTSEMQYTLSLGNFGRYQTEVQSVVEQALHNLGQDVNAKGVFDLRVVPETVKSSILAETTAAMVNTPTSLLDELHNANKSSAFQVESQTGIDANGNQADATLYINMANILSLNLNPLLAPTSSQYDLTSVVTHELFHAIGFNGFLGGSSTINLSHTAFDNEVTIQNGQPYFTGANAEANYNNAPVPLAPADAGAGSAYYHVNVANDLMSESISRGEVKTISALDLAMLNDIGITTVGVADTHIA